MKLHKVSILSDSVVVGISTPTLRTEQKSQRVLRAFYAAGHLIVESALEWDFAALVGRLAEVQFPDKEAFINSPDLQTFGAWVDQWLNLAWDNTDAVNALYEAYLDLHIDIVNAWKDADKQVATDLIIAHREQLPDHELTQAEKGELAKEDSPLANGAKSTA